MAEDIRERKRLEEKYPGVFLQTKYEDLATNPTKAMLQIYSHIGEEAPEYVLEAVQGDVQQKRKLRLESGAFGTLRYNSSNTAYAWVKNIDTLDKQHIDVACQDLYALSGYRWPQFFCMPVKSSVTKTIN